MKKISLMLMLLVIFAVPVNAAYAQEAVDPNEVTQAELDRRMSIVFDYLNTHATEDSFNGQESLVYDIPVGDGVIVTVEISNKEEAQANARTTYGQSSYNVSANTTYNFTLTISNVVNSGDSVTYTVNYSTGSPIPNRDRAYLIRVNSVLTSAQPTGLYSVSSKYSTISNNNEIAVTVSGYVTFSHPTLSNKTLYLNSLDISSQVGGLVQYLYNYDVN